MVDSDIDLSPMGCDSWEVGLRLLSEAWGPICLWLPLPGREEGGTVC